MRSSCRALPLIALLLGSELLAEDVWSTFSPTTRPPALSRYGIAYDAARRRAVLFGGRDVAAQARGETWEWDGQNWTLAAIGGPSPRSGHAMVYDASRSRIVLHGGRSGSGFLFSDTWGWNGTAWTLLSSAGPQIHLHGLAYEATRARMLLFGGEDSTGGLRNDTWDFDGFIWTPRAPGTRPTRRRGITLASDDLRGRSVLFGGEDALGLQADTWEWDGATWIFRSTATAPAARSFGGLAFDPAGRRTLLFGGAPFLGDTWSWDGTTWTQLAPVSPPSARRELGIVFDAARGGVILFGGLGPLGPTDDTLELFQFCRIVGPGHSGGSAPISCAGPPRLGTTACFTVSNSPAPGISLLILSGPCLRNPIPVGPPGFCDPGSLYTFPLVVILGRFGAPTTYCYPIPLIPQLIGIEFCLQGGSFETAGCYRLTGGLAAVIVP